MLEFCFRRRLPGVALVFGVLASGLLTMGTATAAVHFVTTTDDTVVLDGCGEPAVPCSLRQAIEIAAHGDEIRFDEALHFRTIYLTQNYFINKSLRIIGPGPDKLTIDGQGQSGLFYIVTTSQLTAELSGLSLTGGNGQYLIYNGINQEGAGALYSEDARLVVRNVDVYDNTGLRAPIVFYNGVATLVDSYIHDNTATIGCSGVSGDFYDGIVNSTIANNVGPSAPVCGSLDIFVVNTTISGNQASGDTLGVRSRRATILNSTITNNTSTSTAEKTQTLRLTAPGQVANSIVMGNTSEAIEHVSCARTSDIDLSYSLIHTPDECAPIPGPGNIVQPNAPVIGSLINALSDNGGPAPTHALVNFAGNPLIDAGDPAGCVDNEGMLLTTDARGSRRAGAGCDIGAYEISNYPPVLTVPPAQTVIEGEVLSFQLNATDPDGDGLTYRALHLTALDDDDSLEPLGATLDPNTGIFEWPTTAGQAGNYQIEFTVYDDASPVELDMDTVMITVGLPNRPPVIDEIAPIEAEVGEPLVISIARSDPDGDRVDLTWQDLPAGASLGEGEDTLYWTPAPDQVGTFTIEITGTDRGEPPLTDTATLVITVGFAATPEEILVLLEDIVIAIGLGQNDEKALLKPVGKALKHLGKGKTSLAVKELNKFISEVRAQLAQGVLTPEEADELEALAQQAIEVLTQT